MKSKEGEIYNVMDEILIGFSMEALSWMDMYRCCR